MNKIIPAYKPIGMTPLEIVDQCKAKYGYQKVAYAGRLDPMAYGLLLLMVDDACKERDSLQNLDKKYRFKLIQGIKTDSYDILGMPKIGAPEMALKEIEETKGKIEQKYPHYSSFRLNGIPLFRLARENRINEDEIPSKTVEIKEFKIIKVEEVKVDELIHEFIRQIKLVKGDFRQEEIINTWEELLNNLNARSVETLIVHEIEVTVSSGTYVRSLANRIGEKIGSGAIAFEIFRSEVGDYNISTAEKY